MIKMLSQNAIGCLLLLAAFYVVGIVNLSRWALFLFWVVSSIGLIVKRSFVYGRIARRRAEGIDTKNVLLIGDGKLGEDYIRSIQANPQFGINIVGHLGNSDRLKTDVDALFDVENYPELIIHWLGGFSAEAVEKAIREKNVECIVIADEHIPDEIVAEIFKLGRLNDIKTLMSVQAASLINYESGIHDLGETKQVELLENVKKRTIYPTGMVITFALLLLILITGKFEMQAVRTLKGFDDYRCIMFALFAFFMYLSLGDVVARKKDAVKRAGMTWLVCTALIVVYEFIYDKAMLQSIRTDVIIMSVLLGLCFTISVIAGELKKNSFVLLD